MGSGKWVFVPVVYIYCNLLLLSKAVRHHKPVFCKLDSFSLAVQSEQAETNLTIIKLTTCIELWLVRRSGFYVELNVINNLVQCTSFDITYSLHDGMS